jgi:hypothetical protein
LIHRALDVVFQYVFWLAAGPVAAPLLVGGASFALDRSETVAGRLTSGSTSTANSAKLAPSRRRLQG